MYPPSRSMLRRLVAWGSSVLPPSMMPADGAQRTYVLNFRELLRDELPKTPLGRSSQNSPSRNCPKSLGGACNVALRATETVLFGPFWPPYTAQFTVGALLVPLFGQFLRYANSGHDLPYVRRGGDAEEQRARGCRLALCQR